MAAKAGEKAQKTGDFYCASCEEFGAGNPASSVDPRTGDARRPVLPRIPPRQETTG